MAQDTLRTSKESVSPAAFASSSTSGYEIEAVDVTFTSQAPSGNFQPAVPNDSIAKAEPARQPVGDAASSGENE
ncbi:hypothetical protein [Spirosoma pulveris]